MSSLTEYTCDICGFKTKNEMEIHDAKIKVSGTTGDFYVCSTCWTEAPKGVFRVAFNKLLKALGK